MSDLSSKDLLQCPFCGGKNLHHGEAYVTCLDCQADGPFASGKSWNDRAAPEPPAAPMKLLFDNDSLRRHAETDPDDEPTAGGPAPSRKELIDEIGRLSNAVAELKGHVRLFEQRASQPPFPVPSVELIARVINNNQPGWTNIVETAPNVTLDVGTPLYSRDSLMRLTAALAGAIHRAEDAADDAERYRFLRQPGNSIVYAKDRNAWGEGNSGHVRYDTPEKLDAAVDAARSALTKLPEQP